MRIFAVVTLAALLLAAAMGNCGCRTGTPAVAAPDPVALGRTPDEQAKAAVEIRMVCVGMGTVRIGLGSGVQVSADGVITAAHVIECAGESSIVVKAAGSWNLALIRLVDFEADVAALQLLLEVPSTRATLGHRPQVGDGVCLVVVVPKPARRCGTVNTLEEGDSDRHDVFTEAGNSGSGVYDSTGRLVGIVTRRQPLEKGPGGLFMTLEDRPWMVRR